MTPTRGWAPSAPAAMVVAMVLGLLPTGCGLWPGQDCAVNAYAVAKPADGWPEVEVDGRRLVVGQSADHRAPGCVEPLYHYLPEELVGYDGVVFDDCVVVWIDGQDQESASGLGNAVGC